jgi:WD40 repeat protein/serine/threonine protein kinase
MATQQVRVEKEVFLGALERRNPEERKEFVSSTCGSNMELRHRVEALLREHESAGSFLERPVWTEKGGMGPLSDMPNRALEGVAEQPGDKIGQYTLVRKIGEGGCGVVYHAHQEEPFHREVALKVIKLGMDTRRVIARFEAERQTLALMDHSSIARVFDAGATPTGRPFFVMELVRGIKLTEHCDRNQLGLEARLRLFIQVCHAIQHAHQKGVIHRDIKPSNILISGEDNQLVPKIIDFGIAQAIDRQISPQLTEIVGLGQLVGTPAYMSPEQATLRQVEVDTRSDIYSLGVVFYELLTGRTPFEDSLLAQDPDEWRRILLEQEPSRPSAVLERLPSQDLAPRAQKLQTKPRRLVQALRGDLDWIVMKALEKDRARRYSTAREFAQDLEYYLAGEPVLARPPSNLYRLQKLVRRHRTTAIAVSGAAAVLVVATAVSSRMALRATQAENEARISESLQVQLRREAELEREKARAQADSARMNEYVADINLAQQSLISGNYGRGVQLLKKYLPQRGVPDLRGFEWRYLWRVSRGEDHVAFAQQGSAVRTLAVSPNGQFLAAGTDDHLRIWDLSSSALLRTLSIHQISAVFCADGRELVVSTPSNVRVIDLHNGTETLLPHQDGGSLAISKDGARLAISGREGVHVWATKDWTSQIELSVAFAPTAFSPDGQLLASATRDGIAIWDLKRVQPKLVLENSRNAFPFRGWEQLGKAITFSADGLQLIAPRNRPSESGSFQLDVWDVQSGQQSPVIPQDPQRTEHTGIIAGLALSPDGNTLATASMDHSIRLWDLQSRREPTVLHGHLTEVWSVAFSPDGRTLISGAKDGSINLWSIPVTSRQDVLEGPYTPESFSPDGKRLAVLDQERGALVFMNSATRESEDDLVLGHWPSRGPGRLALSSDQNVLAEALGNGSIILHDTHTKEATKLQGRGDFVFDMALSPDGRQLVTGGPGPSRWWDLATRTNVVFGDGMRRPLFSPDGRTLLLLNRAGRAELWDSTNRSLRLGLGQQSSFGPGAAFSPNGRVLAIASDPLSSEQMITLWDTFTGQLLGSCVGHKQGIVGLAFSPDGRTLASVSHDSTLKLWSTATFQQLLDFTVPGGVSSPVFSPDGTFLIAAGSPQQRGIHFFNAPQPENSDSGTRLSAIP